MMSNGDLLTDAAGEPMLKVFIFCHDLSERKIIIGRDLKLSISFKFTLNKDPDDVFGFQISGSAPTRIAYVERGITLSLLYLIQTTSYCASFSFLSPGGVAASMGLQVGDALVRLNGTNVVSCTEESVTKIIRLVP